MIKFFKNLGKIVRLLNLLVENDITEGLMQSNERMRKINFDKERELQNLKGRILNYRNNFANDVDVRTQFINEFPANLW